MTEKIIYNMMSRAMELSKSCSALTFPNPKVGAVIFDDDGKIISEGFTECYGSDHAETAALKKLKFNASNLNMAVTLEPCNHFGKTPPCSQSILRSGIKKIFIAKKEENEKACNGGCFLSENGVQVFYLDEFAHEVEKINRFFFKNIRTGLPWITVKIAVSSDGFITSSLGQQTIVTGKSSQIYTHNLRASHMAIAVGAGTVNVDNPRLTVRNVIGKNPQPIIFSRDLSLNSKMDILQNSPIILTSSSNNTIISIFNNSGADVQILNEGFSIKDALLILYKKHNINSILVEGGAKLISSFLEENLVDEFQINMSQKSFCKGLKLFNNSTEIIFRNNFEYTKEKFFDSDHLRIFRKKDNPPYWY